MANPHRCVLMPTYGAIHVYILIERESYIMEKVQKSRVALIATTLLAGLIVLSACGNEPATSTPIQGSTATVPAQTGLGVDATLVPFPTSAAATPATVAIPESIRTAAANVTPSVTAEAQGEIVADLGFRANPDGYSFENYAGKKRNGKAVPELFVDDLQKMFGDADVCIKIENGKCTPRQEAVDWLEMLNSDPPGGHCEGMAVSSLLLFKGMDTPANYDAGAEKTFDVDFTNDVQRLISYYYYLQFVDPVASEYSLAEQLKPSEVLDAVIASMQDGAPDPVNLGFYGGEPDEHGFLSGHSITPYSVEDKGNGIFWIHAYDNNWPDKADVYMEIDRVNETWSYDLSAQNPEFEPEVWEGDAQSQTLAALPLSWRTGTLICPWCDDASGSTDGVAGSALKAVAPGLSLVNSVVTRGQQTAAQRSSTMQIMLEGDGSLLIENSKGQRLGYEGTTLVREIPGARVVRPRTGKGAAQPVFFVPKGDAYTISLNGQAVKAGAAGKSNLSLFGQGLAVTIRDIELNQGEQHKLNLSADAQDLGFVAGSDTVKPTFRVSTTVNKGPGALFGGTTSYQFQLGNVDLTKGQQVDFTLSKSTGQFDFKATGGAATASSYDLDIVRTHTGGTQAFRKMGISLIPNDTHQLNFGTWTSQPVSIDIDRGSKGNFAEKQPVPTVLVPTPTPQP